MDFPSGLGIEICFEHHPREKWAWYANRARELGVSFARIGEFIWDMLESGEGEFHFEDLDTFIHLLEERGIQTWLATPTAAPPDWVAAVSPEILPVSVDGIRSRGETRRHTCPTSPAYRRHSRRIVEAMGHRYGRHPAVVAWQIDNELGHPFCYCPLCHRAFQQWLEREFAGDIEAFNVGLGQYFWARTSWSFTEIPLPGPRANPCLMQAYQRFMDHQIRECWGAQAQWLREMGVVAPITTNSMLTWHGYDHEKFFVGLDVATGDSYPCTHDGIYHSGRFPGLAFLSAFLRGMKHGQNFGIAETRCGPTEVLAQYPRPGEIRYWNHVFFGTGADFVTFFRLDTCPSGRERNTCGLIPASGAIPEAFEEIQQLAGEVARLDPWLKDTTVETAPVGILYAFPSHVALTIRPEFAAFAGPFGNGYTMYLARHFRAMARQGFRADVVFEGEDFSKYRLLILPALVAMESALAERLRRFVAEGGVLVLWPWCGVMDENAKMHERPLPAFLDDMAGVESVITEAFAPEDAALVLRGGFLGSAEVASDGLMQTLKVREEGEILSELAGHPAKAVLPGLVRRQFGRGTCYTVSTSLTEDGLAVFYHELLGLCGITPEMTLPPGIHHALRVGPKHGLLFLFNSGGEATRLRLAEPLVEVLTGQKAVQEVTFEPLGVAVFLVPQERRSVQISVTRSV